MSEKIKKVRSGERLSAERRARGRDVAQAVPEDAWVSVYVRLPAQDYAVLAEQAREYTLAVGTYARTLLMQHARGLR